MLLKSNSVFSASKADVFLSFKAFNCMAELEAAYTVSQLVLTGFTPPSATVGVLTSTKSESSFTRAVSLTSFPSSSFM